MASSQERIMPVEEGRSSGYTNRAEQIRRDTDTVKSPKVTLYDVDYAMLYHIGTNMRLQVPDNGRLISVPVTYADSEAWTQIRGRGYMRDEKRKIMSPMIALRRTAVNNDMRIPVFGLQLDGGYRKFYPYKNLGNKYDRFGNQINRQPSQEFYMVDVPNYVQVEYDVMIWTTYMEQLNIIIQSFIAKGNQMWGDSYTFRTYVNDVSVNTVKDTGADRVVSATLSLTVDGYLRDEFEYHEPTIRKAFTTKTVRFTNEQEVLEFYTEEPSQFTPPPHSIEEPFSEQDSNKRRNMRYR